MDDETESILNNPRDKAMATIVRAYKSHPYVERAILNQRNKDSSIHRSRQDILSAYLAEAGSYGLLTAQDEVELFGHIERGLEVYRSLESLDNVTPEQADALIKLTAAQQVIFYTNLRLATSIAKPYWQRVNAMPAMDLIQEANVGLSLAINRFDVSKGFKFSTYATWWIRQNVTREIANKSRLIRLPVHVHEKYVKAVSQVKKLSNELERRLTDEEVEKVTGMNIAKFNDLVRRGYPELPSTNALLGDDKDARTLESLLADPTTDMNRDIEEFSNREELKQILSNSRLDSREKFIIGLRNGIDPEVLGPLEVTLKGGTTISYAQAANAMLTDNGLTLEDLGDMLGITRERIRQIQSNGMRVLEQSVAGRKEVS